MKLKNLLIIAALSVFSLASCNNMLNNGGKLSSKADSVSYSLGVSIGSNLKQGGLTKEKINSNAFAKGIQDVFDSAKLQITPEEANRFLQAYFMAMEAEKNAGAKKEGEKFLAENKTKPGVVTLPSGLQYKVIKEGTGPQPKATDVVKCHYKGTLVDGTVFDESYKRGEPVTFPVNGVIPGWTEALQLMKVGSKWQLFIPSELGYGDRQAGPQIGPNSVLIFDVELLGIEPPQAENPQGK